MGAPVLLVESFVITRTEVPCALIGKFYHRQYPLLSFLLWISSYFDHVMVQSRRSVC